MKLNSRLTSGLAWAGLLLVVGVPSANVLWPQGQPAKDALLSAIDAEKPGVAPTAPAAKDVSVASVSPSKDDAAVTSPAAAKANTIASVDPVNSYLASGKALPSYISGGDGSAAPSTPAASMTPPDETTVETTASGITIIPGKTGPATGDTVAKAAAVADQVAPSGPAAPAAVAAAPDAAPAATPDPKPVEVAALPDPTPPIPAPLSLRPKAPVVDKTQTASIRARSYQDQAYPDYVTVPPAEVRPSPDSANAPIVSPEELAAWKSGNLTEYLAANGMLTERPRSRARVWAYRRYVPQADVVVVPSDGQYYDVPDPGY